MPTESALIVPVGEAVMKGGGLGPYEPGESTEDVSISAPDKEAGSPKAGDMIARNPVNHKDQWLVAAQYFAENFEAL